MTVSSDVAAYFEGLTRWREELLALRRIALDCGLTEDWKWRQPCYTFERKNVVIIGELSDACAIGFFKGALLADPAGVLDKSGPNTRAARDARFTSVAEIEAMESRLRELIEQAIEVEKAGLQFDFSDRDDIAMPDELRSRLDRDPALKAAFDTLTPGRRRAYLIVISGAKLSKTRTARVEKYVPKIMDGLGPQEW